MKKTRRWPEFLIRARCAMMVAKRYKYMYTVLNVFCSMSTLLTQVCTECNKFNCIHVDTVDTTL